MLDTRRLKIMVRQDNADQTVNDLLDEGGDAPNSGRSPGRVSSAGKRRGGVGWADTWRIGAAMLAVFAAVPTVRGVGPTLVSVGGPAPQSDQRGNVPDDRLKGGSTDSGKKLAEKLIRQAHGDGDADLMDTILRLMGSAAQRLEIKLDAGEETQALQRTIMDRLDDAIKVAGVRRRSRGQDQARSKGDKRRRPQDESRPQGKRGDAEEDKRDPTSSDTKAVGGTRPHGNRPGGSLQESRRTWGQLPRREREEVIQGVDERYLERYRTWIERYYRALQESDISNTR